MAHPHAIATGNRLFGPLNSMIEAYHTHTTSSDICLPPCFELPLPKNRYEHVEDTTDKTCPICLNDFTSNDKDVVCLRNVCSHLFHKACIHRWIEQKHTCPICKKNVI